MVASLKYLVSEGLRLLHCFSSVPLPTYMLLNNSA